VKKNFTKQTPESRKEQIITAADEILVEVGLENFTIDQVVERAGIAKGTVYKYYTSRDEIIAEITGKALRLLYKKFVGAIAHKKDSIEQIKAVCIANYEYYIEYPEYYKLLGYIERPEFNIAINEYVKISHAIQDLMNGLVLEGQQKKEIRSDIDPVIITSILWASCLGVVQFIETKEKLIKNVKDIELEDVVTAYASMITEGMR
jgi:AcrR family transcriptional regulator